jgi:hypothetical protein
MSKGVPVDLEVLARDSRHSASELLAELGKLEVAGVVARLGAGKFVRLD